MSVSMPSQWSSAARAPRARASDTSASEGATSFAGFAVGMKITWPMSFDGALTVFLGARVLLTRFSAITSRPGAPRTVEAAAFLTFRSVGRTGGRWFRPIGTVETVPSKVLARSSQIVRFRCHHERPIAARAAYQAPLLSIRTQARRVGDHRNP